MTCFKESYLFRLLTLLLAAYQDSGLHRLAVRAGAWCSRQINESAILRPLCREGLSPVCLQYHPPHSFYRCTGRLS